MSACAGYQWRCGRRPRSFPSADPADFVVSTDGRCFCRHARMILIIMIIITTMTRIRGVFGRSRGVNATVAHDDAWTNVRAQYLLYHTSNYGREKSCWKSLNKINNNEISIYRGTRTGMCRGTLPTRYGFIGQKCYQRFVARVHVYIIYVHYIENIRTEYCFFSHMCVRA